VGRGNAQVTFSDYVSTGLKYFAVALPTDKLRDDATTSPLQFQAKIGKTTGFGVIKQIKVDIFHLRAPVYLDVEETDSLGCVQKRWVAVRHLYGTRADIFDLVPFDPDNPSGFLPPGYKSMRLKDTPLRLLERPSQHSVAIGWIGNTAVDPSASAGSSSCTYACYTFESDGSIAIRKLSGDISTQEEVEKAQVSEAEVFNLGYGPPSTEGDVVTSFLDIDQRELSFSINNHHLGVAFKLPIINGSWRPVTFLSRCELQLNLCGPSFLTEPCSSSQCAVTSPSESAATDARTSALTTGTVRSSSLLYLTGVIKGIISYISVYVLKLYFVLFAPIFICVSFLDRDIRLCRADAS
jgi:hypothetical protein